jgi:hypothetical protein
MNHQLYPRSEIHTRGATTGAQRRESREAPEVRRGTTGLAGRNDFKRIAYVTLTLEAGAPYVPCAFDVQIGKGFAAEPVSCRHQPTWFIGKTALRPSATLRVAAGER